MSYSSSNNSGSPQKGFFKRMLSQDQGKGAKQSEVKQRHPGFVVSTDSTVTPGRMSKPQEVVISPAVKQLSKEGYVVFNTPEKQDVYITIQPESAFFEDEEPKMVKMAGGSFVGAKQGSSAEVPLKTEPESEPVKYVQPADIFSNAARRDEYEEIDFNEIIIKKNDSFEEEIEETPVLFKPSFEEVYEPMFEETFKISREPEIAKTSTDAAKVEAPKISFTGYKEVPEYTVEEAPFRGMFVETPPVTDVPAGLYVDGHRAVNRAEAGAGVKKEHPMFIEAPMEADVAVTSAATLPMIEQVMVLQESPLEYFGYLPTLEKTDEADEIAVEDTVETTAEDTIEITVEDVSEIAVEDTVEATVEDVVEITVEDAVEATVEGAVEAIVEDAVEATVEDAVEAIVEDTAEITVEDAVEATVGDSVEIAVEDAVEITVEETSETIADIPKTVDVVDLVADIMKLTIPGLHMSDEMLSELAQDTEATIPDDGLESYDCKFEPLRMPVKEESVSCAVYYGTEDKGL
ncbi:MAG: hypothetical protein FWG96_06510 [Methanomassiliicoccaceae archaeon]|nr:hypothetical protein [Methanomassiliicoccaceae archaeon]